MDFMTVCRILFPMHRKLMENLKLKFGKLKIVAVKEVEVIEAFNTE